MRKTSRKAPCTATVNACNTVGSHAVGQIKPAGKMKLEFLENPSSTLLGFSRISNLIQAHALDSLVIVCWYWPDLAIFQADKLGIGRINLNFRQKHGFQSNSSLSDSLKIQAQC